MLITQFKILFFLFHLLSKYVKIEIYNIKILPVLLYGCETRSLMLKKVHRLSVFENRVIRRIFGPKRDEVRGGWRKLPNEELRNLYSSPDIIGMIKSRRMGCIWRIVHMGEIRYGNRILVEKAKGKRPLASPRQTMEDNIKKDLRVGDCGVDSSGAGEGLVAGSFENGNEPSSSIKDWDVLLSWAYY
jgi:hypothetical protein